MAQMTDKEINILKNQNGNYGKAVKNLKKTIKSMKKMEWIKIIGLSTFSLILGIGGTIGVYAGVKISNNKKENLISLIKNKDLGTIKLKAGEKTATNNEILIALENVNTNINIYDFYVAQSTNSSALIGVNQQFNYNQVQVSYTIQTS